jgi:hypothetical protein
VALYFLKALSKSYLCYLLAQRGGKCEEDKEGKNNYPCRTCWDHFLLCKGKLRAKEKSIPLMNYKLEQTTAFKKILSNFRLMAL